MSLLRRAIFSALAAVTVVGSAPTAWAGEADARAITVTAGTYGGNHGVPHGNRTELLAQKCDGQETCNYWIGGPEIGDPAPYLKKDYVAEWTCAGDPAPRRAGVADEAGGKTVALSCADGYDDEVLKGLGSSPKYDWVVGSAWWGSSIAYNPDPTQAATVSVEWNDGARYGTEGLARKTTSRVLAATGAGQAYAVTGKESVPVDAVIKYRIVVDFADGRRITSSIKESKFLDPPKGLAAFDAFDRLAQAMEGGKIPLFPLSSHPVEGLRTNGRDYAVSPSKGDFGADLQFYAKATGRNYEALCRSTEPAYQCEKAAAAGVGPYCEKLWAPVHAEYCGHKGTGGGVEARARVGVTVFGKDADLFDVSARVDKGVTGGGMSFMGMRFASIPAAPGFTAPAEHKRVFQETIAETSFMLGPIPVYASVGASGTVGFDGASLSAGTTGVTADFTPFGRLDAFVKAGVGSPLASAGVKGKLLLVKLGTPAYAGLSWADGRTFSYDTSLGASLESLSGSVGVYVSMAGFDTDFPIFDWTGFRRDVQLGYSKGQFNL